MRGWFTAMLLAACRFDFDPVEGLERCDPQAAVTAIEMGERFMCVQLADATLACWGDGGEGQLGAGEFAAHDDPRSPIGLGPVEKFSLSKGHACAIEGGNVFCWGRNHTGQLGINSTMYRPTPAAVGNVANAVEIATGGMNTCAITATGQLWCWGQNHGTSPTTTIRVPAQVMGVPPVQKVTLATTELIFSGGHGCAVGIDGSVWCWGDNSSNQLGVTGMASSDVPVRAGLLQVATDIAAGDLFTCAIVEGGDVFCWGQGSEGRLGDGGTTSRAEPRRVEELAGVVELDGHNGTMCARTSLGEVFCWGQNYGDETPGHPEPFAARPVKLPFRAATTIAVGASHACALEDGIVYCWGRDRIDRPGALSLAPVAVTSLAGVDDIRAAGDRTCAHASDNSIWCWGDNSFGQVGDGTRTNRSAPVSVATGSNVGTGIRHTCATTSDATVACWGDNDSAQVTGARSGPIVTPTQIADINGAIVATAPGGHHTCMRLANDDLWCWGANYEGQSALPNSLMMSPPMLSMFPQASTISSGSHHTCVLETATNALVCAGRNNENQIDATGADAYTPRQILTSATAVSAQGEVSCALSAGDALCWGDNMHGQLGDGSHDNRGMPLVVLPGAVEIVAGQHHVCARTSAGEAWCWGANDSGQFGDGTRVSTRTPVRAPMLDAAVQLALGNQHTCMRLADGTVNCVGSDTRGQLGNGGALPDPKPTPAAISCP